LAVVHYTFDAHAIIRRLAQFNVIICEAQLGEQSRRADGEDFRQALQHRLLYLAQHSDLDAFDDTLSRRHIGHERNRLRLSSLSVCPPDQPRSFLPLITARLTPALRWPEGRIRQKLARAMPSRETARRESGTDDLSASSERRNFHLDREEERDGSRFF